VIRIRFACAALFLLLTCVTAGSLSQSDSSTANASGVIPERGFISKSGYTNAFFGFSLPLPKDYVFLDFKAPFKIGSCGHFLFGLDSVNANTFGTNPRLTVLIVTANQSSSASPEEARKAAAGPKGQSVTQVEIGGKEFWKSEVQEKVPEGNMHTVLFATALTGYVLQFAIESFDGRLTNRMQHCIEAIRFFDPDKAREVAGPGSRAYSPATSALPPCTN